MGIFKRDKTPPPAASEVSHDHTGNPIQMTSTTPVPVVHQQTGTTFSSEMPASQYTQQDAIHNAPPPAGAPHFNNEKTAGINDQQTGYTSDPNLLHNQQQQQHVYPDANAQQAQHSQSQIHVQQPAPQYHDSFAHDKAQLAQHQQQYPQQNQHQQNHPQGNVYNVARPIHTLQKRSEVVDCPNCGVRELTRTQFTSGGTTYGMAALLCFCFCLGCLPFIGHWVKDCEHCCGSCNQLLAIWHRSGDTEVIARGTRPAGQQQQQQQKPGGKGATYD